MLALVSDNLACARFLAPDFVVEMLMQVGEGGTGRRRAAHQSKRTPTEERSRRRGVVQELGGSMKRSALSRKKARAPVSRLSYSNSAPRECAIAATIRAPQTVALLPSAGESDAIVFDGEDEPAAGVGFQPQANLAGGGGVGILDRVGDQFGRNDADGDRFVGGYARADGVDGEGRGETFHGDGASKFVNQLPEIDVQIHDENIFRCVESAVQVGHRGDASLGFAEHVLALASGVAEACMRTSAITSARLLATRWLTSSRSALARSRSSRASLWARSFSRLILASSKARSSAASSCTSKSGPAVLMTKSAAPLFNASIAREISLEAVT